MIITDIPKTMAKKGITKCEVEDCKQYFDIKERGKGTQKYCHVHKEIIRHQKQRLYSRKNYEKQLRDKESKE